MFCGNTEEMSIHVGTKEVSFVAYVQILLNYFRKDFCNPLNDAEKDGKPRTTIDDVQKIRVRNNKAAGSDDFPVLLLLYWR